MRRAAFAPRLAPALAAAATTLAAPGGPGEREAGACSCMGPRLTLLSPERVDNAPVNARVRAEVPASRLPGSAANKLVLRAVGGAEVAVTMRTFAPGGRVEVVELVPRASLEPSTRYEVAFVDPEQYPSTIVFGTFRTGGAADTTPPRLGRLGPASAHRSKRAGGGSCQIAGPWVVVEGVRADDPDRAGAQLSFGVWLGDASGGIDASKPPTTIVSASRRVLHVGRTSLCDPHDFPLPKAGPIWLGIAALDEAGNASPLRRVRVNMAGRRR
ncbi:MAG TPA: hypothetical protein VFS43_23525 [Polyangiaceae bacterium]|nr:hypothetical protein [Polyangiaceae bacterium]